MGYRYILMCEKYVTYRSKYIYSYFTNNPSTIAWVKLFESKDKLTMKTFLIFCKCITNI